MNKLYDIGLLLDNLTPIQKQYMKDRHRFIVLTSGRRSRKTLISIYKIFIESIKKRNKKYFFGAPTRKQAKAIFWERNKKMYSVLDMISEKSETELQILLKNGTLIRVVGLDSAERIEGETPSWDGAVITESADLKQEVWQEHVRPVFSDTNGFCILDGVPDLRKPWYVDLIEYAAGGRVPETQHLTGAYSENPNDKEWCYYNWFSSDVLPEREIEVLKQSYDPKIYRQEFEGSIERSGGIVYYAYKEENRTDVKYDPNRVSYLTFDFNVNPMTAILIQTVGNQEVAVKEFVLHDSNTKATGLYVDKWLQDNEFRGTLEITGDASGVARKSAATRSDWYILEQIFKNYDGFRLKITKRNPAIKERVNTLNAMFENVYGQRKLLINNELSYTHKDLTRQTYKEDGTLNDSGNIGHRSDALGYFAINYYPLRKLGKVEQI